MLVHALGGVQDDNREDNDGAEDEDERKVDEEGPRNTEVGRGDGEEEGHPRAMNTIG